MTEPTLSEAQLSAIREYANDLRDMTAMDIKRELDIVSDLIDDYTSWQEALSSRLEQMTQEASR